jgi:hypothetical protein
VVDGQRAEVADERGLGLVEAAEQGADAAAELGVGERLRDDVVSAVVEYPHAVELVSSRGENDHGRVRVDLAGESIAVADGVEQPERLSVDVGEHKLRSLVGEEVQRVLAVLGEQDAVAVGDELVGEKGTGDPVFVEMRIRCEFMEASLLGDRCAGVEGRG